MVIVAGDELIYKLGWSYKICNSDDGYATVIQAGQAAVDIGMKGRFLEIHSYEPYLHKEILEV